MTSARQPGLVLIAFFIFSGLYAQRPSIGKTASWVVQTATDYNLSKFPPGSEGGYMDLLTEKQVDLASRCVYRKKSRKIITQAGVQNGSEVSVTYDPSYERLVFHDVHVVREGRVINKLDLSKVRTAKEESEMDRSVYNGTVSSVIFLEDIRKEDIVEYSYSLIGFNPVFSNKYSDFLEAGYSVPVGRIFYRIICPVGRTLHVRNDRSDVQPVIVNTNGVKTYQWEFNNVPGVKSQDELPDWYDPYPSVMVSEFGTWNEVCRWAMPLFTTGSSLSGVLKDEIREIRDRAGDDTVQRILRALHFVQDEIRYQGIEMGVNSHKPNSPERVLEQRFGDCKDKSFLLCTILSQLGVDASPVLINTTYQDQIAGWLPSALDFNHATVRVRLDNKTWWFDATISSQRGGIDDISFPDYKCGLVLTDSTSGLTMIPLQDPGQVIAKEHFVLEDHFGAAKLEVVTRYTGSFADAMRDELNSDSKANIQQRYQNFYTGYYSGARSVDSLVTEDDEKTGAITIHETYKIDKLWELKNGKGRASFYGSLIGGILKKPREQDRRMPVAQTYPAHYTEELEIQTPEDWDFEKTPSEIRSSAFVFGSTISATERTVNIKYEYTALKDHIPAQDATAWFSDYDKLKEDLGYELTRGETADTVSPVSSHTDEQNGNLLKALFCIVLIAAIGYRLRRR